MRVSLCGVGLVMAACASGPTVREATAPVEPPAPRPAEVPPLEAPRPPGAALRPVPIADVVSLSVGEEHACVARADGQVWCWGSGATYRLGQGLIESSKAPVLVQGVAGAVRVAAGGSMSCAIGRDGGVSCWGGYRRRPGDDGFAWPLVRRPEVVAWPVSWTRQVGVGWVQATLVDAAGAVSILDAYLGPVSLPAFAPVVSVAALRDGFCALTRDGRVQCVTSSELGAAGNGGGEGGYGGEPSSVLAPLEASTVRREELFDADGDARLAPCATWDEEHTAPAFCKDTLVGARALDAYGDLACAVLADGGVACWGCADCWSDDPPPLGLPKGPVASIPFVVPGVSGVREIAVGRRHICALHGDGAVRCWGDDAEGQLGPAASGRSASPVVVPGLGEVVHIDAGEATTCALDKGGEVRCWGHVLGTALPEREVDPEPPEVPEVRAVTERVPPEEVGERGPHVCREVDVFDVGGVLTETRHGYDRAGRVVTTRVARWTPDGLVPEREMTYTRDREGRARRERVSEAREDGTVNVWRIDFRRDAAGRVLWQRGRGTTDDSPLRFAYDTQGRLVRSTSELGGALELTWSERAGAPGTRFEGLGVHEANAEYELRYEVLPGPVKLAYDASGREVYRREYEEGMVVDTWRTFDLQGRESTLLEERFEEPFFEDPIERRQYRHVYDESGRLVATEVYTLGGDGAALARRTVHLYTGCIDAPRGP